MNSIVIAIIVVAALGLIGAVLLVIASKALAVTENENIKEVTSVLPGANCGACGFSGCAAYAKAIVEDGAPVNQCSAGGAATAEKIAAIMDVEVGKTTEYKAMVACRGDNQHVKKRYEYQGIESCVACNLYYNGDTSCAFGCLGYGDCAKACKFDAIEVIDGLAHVNPEKCTGCGACKAACPKKIIFMYEFKERPKPIVMCSNHKVGAETRRECAYGCIGCGKCVRECPVDCITINVNVARIDYSRCIGCGKCSRVCPVECIQMPDRWDEKTKTFIKRPVIRKNVVKEAKADTQASETNAPA